MVSIQLKVVLAVQDQHLGWYLAQGSVGSTGSTPGLVFKSRQCWEYRIISRVKFLTQGNVESTASSPGLVFNSRYWEYRIISRVSFLTQGSVESTGSSPGLVFYSRYWEYRIIFRVSFYSRYWEYRIISRVSFLLKVLGVQDHLQGQFLTQGIVEIAHLALQFIGKEFSLQLLKL